MKQACRGLFQGPDGLRRFDFHYLIDGPKAILFRQNLLQAGGEASAKTKAGPVLGIAVIRVFRAAPVEQIEKMPLALAWNHIHQQHVAIVLDRC